VRRLHNGLVMMALVAVCIFAPKAVAQDISNLEPYPGTKKAVRQTLDQLPPARIYLADNAVDEVGPTRVAAELLPVCYDRQVYVGGFSHHDTKGQPNSFKQQNPSLGSAFTIGCEMWIHPTFQWMHVFLNSRKGTTDIKGLGLEACLRTQGLDFCYSSSRAYARMTDERGRAVSGWVPKLMPAASLGKGRWRVYIVPLDQNTYYLFIGIGF
jgi:hypothetical protein